jgi:hypothetical protein
MYIVMLVCARAQANMAMYMGMWIGSSWCVFIKLYHDGRSTIHDEMPNISTFGDKVSYNPYNVDLVSFMAGNFYLSA